MVVTPIARQSVADQLYEQLLDLILSGSQPAGSTLPPERELATTAGVNRQAVREALQRLRQADLIEIVHGGGVRVLDWRTSAGLGLLPVLLLRTGRAVDPDVARSIMELRASIGADAAARSAERSAVPTGDALLALVREMEAVESDALRWGTLGWQFWEAIVDGADNIAYRLAFNTLRAVGGVVAPLLPSILGSEWASRDQYRQVADAVRAGDPETAHASATAVLQRGVAAVADYFAAAGPGPVPLPAESPTI